MDVFDAIRNRRSTRVYMRDPVADECTNKLIDATRMAPSAGNIQPWEFIVVRGSDAKNRLSAAAIKNQSWNRML